MFKDQQEQHLFPEPKSEILLGRIGCAFLLQGMVRLINEHGLVLTHWLWQSSSSMQFHNPSNLWDYVQKKECSDFYLYISTNMNRMLF